MPRLPLYRQTIIGHWLLFATGLLVWRISGRDWSVVGVSLELDWRFWAGAGFAVAAILVFLIQLWRLKNAEGDSHEGLSKHLERVALMLPHTRSELRGFYSMSFAAGVVEEFLWRGFLIWYLSLFMPLWAAAVVSTIGFGLAHAYQGLSNVPAVLLVGAVFAGLYLLTGSIWIPMVLHTVFDMLQGRLTYEVLRQRATPAQTARSVPACIF